MKDADRIINQVKKLIAAYKQGLLGGETMPEDSNPGFELGSKENFLYFTLPMALNYQRNSYKLWQGALATYDDATTRHVFVPDEVLKMSDDELRDKLTKYKVALQPNKQPEIWRKICQTLVDYFDGDVRSLFRTCDNDIKKILLEIQKTHKKGFPYLSGNKIANYWLYVMTQYTNADLKNRSSLNIAPDTHVIQASIKLGLLDPESVADNQLQVQTAKMWDKLLAETAYDTIDVHTPLWLWSRGGFVSIE